MRHLPLDWIGGGEELHGTEAVKGVRKQTQRVHTVVEACAAAHLESFTFTETANPVANLGLLWVVLLLGIFHHGVQILYPALFVKNAKKPGFTQKAWVICDLCDNETHCV